MSWQEIHAKFNVISNTHLIIINLFNLLQVLKYMEDSLNVTHSKRHCTAQLKEIGPLITKFQRLILFGKNQTNKFKCTRTSILQRKQEIYSSITDDWNVVLLWFTISANHAACSRYVGLDMYLMITNTIINRIYKQVYKYTLLCCI